MMLLSFLLILASVGAKAQSMDAYTDESCLPKNEDFSCCTPEKPCKSEMTGDCDNHDDCDGDMLCGSNNCGEDDTSGNMDCCFWKPCQSDSDCDHHDHSSNPPLICGYHNCGLNMTQNCCAKSHELSLQEATATTTTTKKTTTVALYKIPTIFWQLPDTCFAASFTPEEFQELLQQLGQICSQFTTTSTTTSTTTTTTTTTMDEKPEETTTTSNYPPVAVILPPMLTVILPTDTAVFNGSTSTDDLLIVSYHWELVSGPPGYYFDDLRTDYSGNWEDDIIDDLHSDEWGPDFASEQSIELFELIKGTYIFRLTVYDENDLSDSTTATLIVLPRNYPPMAVILPPMKTVILPKDMALFNGSTSTDDVKVVSYFWQLVSGPPGFHVDLPSDNKSQSVWLTNLIAGNYTISLTVTDEPGLSDTTTATLVVLPPLPCLIAIGGDTLWGPTETIEVVGEGEGSDVSYTSLPAARWGHVAVNLPHSSKFLVCGGKGMHHDPTNLQTCLIHDNSTWVLHSRFRRPRHYAVTVTMDSGDIYVLGGSYSPTTSDVLYIDSDNWSQGPNLPRGSFIFKACAASINSTHFLTVGGGIFYNQVSVFNTVTNTWVEWPSLHDRRRGHNCAKLGEFIVVAGGYLFGEQDYTSSSVLIDINTGVEYPGGEMLRRRAYYSVQVLHGILYAIGGSTFHHESTVGMLVDPMDSWTSSELNLVTGRSTFATVKCARTIPSTYGQNLLYSITIRTKVGCYNCSSEGVVIRLRGGSRQDQPDTLSEHDGVSCSTDVLDHPDTIDFGDGGDAKFGGGIGAGVTMHDEREMLRDCYQAPLKGALLEGSLEWVGEHGWQPLDICIDWQDNLHRLDSKGGLDNTYSVALRCNLVSIGETNWHIEGCLNLNTPCSPP